MALVRSKRLILIGYWKASEVNSDYPWPSDFVDFSWDAEERECVARYLRTGLIARTYMGYSTCRLCGRTNGDLELSDGKYVWPDGLAHYVEDHGVRLPDRFVRHVLSEGRSIESADRDEEWWKSIRLSKD